MGIDYEYAFVPIAYHVWFPVPDDPFYLYNPGEIRDRNGYYENQETPHFFLDGAIDCGNAPELWTPFVIDQISISSPLEMSFAGSYDPNTLSGQFTVIIHAEDNPGVSNLKLRIALTESNIFWQAPNGSNLHNYIFRDMIPDAFGRSISIAQGETKQFTFSFDVPQPLDEDYCTLVAFVQSDQNREILQAVKIKVNDLNNTTSTDNKAEKPESFYLGQNYPNPFNAKTAIGFQAESGDVKLSIYDITGSIVKTLFDGNTGAKNQTIVWDGTNENGKEVSSGIYYYRISNGERSQIRRMTLLK